MSHPVPAVSHVQEVVEEFLPVLRPAQQRGLAEWVSGVLAAGSGGEAAVLAALEAQGLEPHAARARLRELLCDGPEKAAPCATSLDVEAGFAPLLAGILAWWAGDTLPLASDATNRREHEVVLSLSVLSRSSAIPVAWVVRPHRGKGAGIPHLERLLSLLGPAVPASRRVLVMTDQGLWSPPLRRQIVAQGWHPVLRIRPDATFAPAGQGRQQARALVPGPGSAWVGEGVADKDKPKQLACTLLVVWSAGQKDPWLLLTDLPPEQVDGSGYGLRVWIALGFRALKSFGGDWQRTRRTQPGTHRPPLAGAGPGHAAQPGGGHPAGGGSATRACRQDGCAGRTRPPPGAAAAAQRLCPGAGAAAPVGAAGRAGGAPCGCCRSRCPRWPTTSRSSAMGPLQEGNNVYTSPSQPARRERGWG